MDKCELVDQLRRGARENISTNITSISHQNEPNLEPEHTDEENTELVYNLTTPLQNPLIINYIFNFLELEDIEQCRLVCSKWNQLSISFLEKMSVVTLGCPNKEYSPKTFKEFSPTSDINFRAFKLANLEHPHRPWPKSAVVEFLQEQRETMLKLIMDNIEVVGHPKLPIFFSVEDHFDISSHFFNPLTHLSITNYYGSKFIVDISKLIYLKSISLDHCALEISKNCVLSPEKFELNHVALVKDGEIMHDILINDLLEFKNLKELSLDGRTTTTVTRASIINIYPSIRFRLSVTDGSSLRLKVKGKVTLDNLSLTSVSVNDFEDSQWEIREKLTLRGISLEHTKMGMTCNELDFGDSTINLGLLSESLEKLTLNGWGEPLKIVCPPLFSRPNLKSFQLVTEYSECGGEDEGDEEDHDNDGVESTDGNGGNDEGTNVDEKGENSRNDNNANEEDSDDEDFPYDPTANPLRHLNYFIDCPNLTTVKLMSIPDFLNSDYASQRLQTEWIPKSTENLFLNGNIRAIGEEFTFNKLVIEENNLRLLMSTLRQLKSKHLVLDLNAESVGKFSKFCQLEKILLKLIKMPYESVAIGSLEMHMDIPAFNKSSFSNFVDERADFYLFHNQKGKAIKKWQFKKMLEK